VASQLRAAIRPMYSSPPGHGAAIAALVLSDPALLAEWKEELRGMAGRIQQMRSALLQALHQVGVTRARAAPLCCVTQPLGVTQRRIETYLHTDVTPGWCCWRVCLLGGGEAAGRLQQLPPACGGCSCQDFKSMSV
jgi:hypothetical protein